MIQRYRHLKRAVSQRLYSQSWKGLWAEITLPYTKAWATHLDVISSNMLLLFWCCFKAQEYSLIYECWAMRNYMWCTFKIISGANNIVGKMITSVQDYCTIPLLWVKYSSRIHVSIIKCLRLSSFWVLQDHTIHVALSLGISKLS